MPLTLSTIPRHLTSICARRGAIGNVLNRRPYPGLMPVGRVHLVYGLAGSGKSTLGRSLCADGSGVRFSLDEWMLRLFPDLHFESREYGAKAADVRELIWSLAEQVLLTGNDVVLDWNSWSRSRRRWAVDRAAVVDAQVIVHTLTASIDTASERARERTERQVPYAHPVTRAGNIHLDGLMEEPSVDEGIEIRAH